MEPSEQHHGTTTELLSLSSWRGDYDVFKAPFSSPSFNKIILTTSSHVANTVFICRR